jgi:hypothetical protein
VVTTYNKSPGAGWNPRISGTFAVTEGFQYIYHRW